MYAKQNKKKHSVPDSDATTIVANTGLYHGVQSTYSYHAGILKVSAEKCSLAWFHAESAFPNGAIYGCDITNDLM